MSYANGNKWIIIRNIKYKIEVIILKILQTILHVKLLQYVEVKNRTNFLKDEAAVFILGWICNRIKEKVTQPIRLNKLQYEMVKYYELNIMRNVD